MQQTPAEKRREEAQKQFAFALSNIATAENSPRIQSLLIAHGNMIVAERGIEDELRSREEHVGKTDQKV